MKHWMTIAAVAAAALFVAFAAMPSRAADLGGNCCTDLEERIAELEATTARKGNRKVSLEISGNINKAIWYIDAPGLSDTHVIENGNDESRVRLKGAAKFGSGWEAGYVLEIGQGKTSLDIDLGFGDVGFVTNNDLYTRQSYASIGQKDIGTISVGLRSMATDDLVRQGVARTDHIAKRLTVQPVSGITVSLLGTELLEIPLEPFNGKKANSVRYDSPSLYGFSLSAAWNSEDDSWDAALKYANHVGGFELVGAVGYYDDKTNDLIESILGPVDLGSTTLTINGGVKHSGTGVFAQGTWSRIEVDDLNITTDAWHVQAGIERGWLAIGPTTLFGEYMDWQDLDLQFYGLGINQNVSESIDLYATARRYDIGGTEIDTVMGGVRVGF